MATEELMEAMMAIDSGVATDPSPAGTNVLTDNTKNWAVGAHKNRLVKIVSGAGAGQLAVISYNVAKSLVIKGEWTTALDTTSAYVILGTDPAAILREELQKLELLAESKNVSIGAGVTINLPSDDGTSIENHKFKTLTTLADYALEVKIQVSDDDGASWQDYYSDTLVANTLWVRSFEEDFFKVRVNLRNPDTVGHTITFCRLKGRKL